MPWIVQVPNNLLTKEKRKWKGKIGKDLYSKTQQRNTPQRPNPDPSPSLRKHTHPMKSCPNSIPKTHSLQTLQVKNLCTHPESRRFGHPFAESKVHNVQLTIELPILAMSSPDFRDAWPKLPPPVSWGRLSRITLLCIARHRPIIHGP
jgi:hypothetical protein